MASNTIELFTDKDIERLEKIKELLKEIKELDNNFSLSNVINVDKDGILVFTTSLTINKENQNKVERQLTEQFGIECKLISDVVSLDKVINIGAGYEKEIDYSIATYYNEEGNPVKEVTTQYKY